MAIMTTLLITNSHAYGQHSDQSIAQTRAMQTRKFINVDLKKLISGIENVVQNPHNTCLASSIKPDTLTWCYAVTNQGRLDFLIQSNIKDKTSILRVSYTKQFQEPSPQEAKDFYSKFFKSMGDILFVDSQKLDMQEIN